ncbi:MAG: VapC toxin family PIN domain ribonuclease [Chloroflexi bacterium HGW-Chloroflexi-9]|nr:MAG: VapC toxin family PIN domain ribonuclease [Chloroflexi bacterium HGW-Chloroflexi-9]
MSADFLDTNIFVYTFDSLDLAKQAAARRLVAEAIEQRSGIISSQVVQETLNVLTGKARVRLSAQQAGRFLHEMLIPLWRGAPTPALYESALSLRDRYGLGFYDSLIVAAALEAGCTRVLSEDLQHGQRIEGLTIENPFR